MVASLLEDHFQHHGSDVDIGGDNEYTHVAVQTPRAHQRPNCTKVNRRKGCPKLQLGKLAQPWAYPRGVAQRNAGLFCTACVYYTAPF